MPWNEISLTVPDELIDAVSGELTGFGATGIWESAEPTSGSTRLVAYFESPADVDGITAALGSVFERANEVPPFIECVLVADRDWGELWKKSWSSFPLARRFYLIPSWLDVECPEDRTPIRIDPGQAFGTGTHETTQLMLQAMEVWLEPRHVVLDLGAGSGILAIAAVLMDARAVLACDNDPIAIEVARENLERNSASRIGLFCGSVDAIADASVGLILCNLTGESIAELFPEIRRTLRPRGIAVLSGILNSQSMGIRQRALLHGFSLLSETSRGEWCALVMRKQ
jgi:ribosomal protein L11 methyltransferase